MSLFDSYTRGGFGSHGFDLSKITNLDDLSPKAQQHLKNVYSTLFAMLALAAVGTYAQIQLQINATYSTLAHVGFLFWLAFEPFRPQDSQQQQKRTLLLSTVSFLQGVTLGPLLTAVSMQTGYGSSMDVGLIGTALGCTALIFGCFSLAAMNAKRRQYMYLGGFLASATSMMCFLGFLNIFLRSPAIYNLKLYGGLFMFSAYIVYDTQVIIEKAQMPNPDYIKDALDLFIDLVAIFVRILIILSKNKGKKEEKKKNR